MAHKMAPDDLRPFPLMARSLHAMGDLDKSLEVLDSYIALSRIEWIYYLKASVLVDKKSYEYLLVVLVSIDLVLLFRSWES